MSAIRLPIAHEHVNRGPLLLAPQATHRLANFFGCRVRNARATSENVEATRVSSVNRLTIALMSPFAGREGLSASQPFTLHARLVVPKPCLPFPLSRFHQRASHAPLTVEMSCAPRLISLEWLNPKSCKSASTVAMVM